MAELTEERQKYYIPDNFIEGGRIFQGKFKTRYFIEGALLAALFLCVALVLVTLILPPLPLQGTIAVFVAFGLPPLIMGLHGYNGDPLSVALASAIEWRKGKTVMLYNPHPKLLAESPLEKELNSVVMRDKLVEAYESYQSKRIAKHENTEYIEGENFEFAFDPNVDYYTQNNQQEKEVKKKGREKPVKNKKSKRKKGVDIQEKDITDSPEKQECTAAINKPTAASATPQAQTDAAQPQTPTAPISRLDAASPNRNKKKSVVRRKGTAKPHGQFCSPTNIIEEHDEFRNISVRTDNSPDDVVFIPDSEGDLF